MNNERLDGNFNRNERNDRNDRSDRSDRNDRNNRTNNNNPGPGRGPRHWKDNEDSVSPQKNRNHRNFDGQKDNRNR